MIKKTLPYQPYKKDINPYAYVEVFKCVIIANEKIDDYHIVNFFWSMFKNIISKWGTNFVKDHFHCNFVEI